MRRFYWQINYCGEKLAGETVLSLGDDFATMEEAYDDGLYVLVNEFQPGKIRNMITKETVKEGRYVMNVMVTEEDGRHTDNYMTDKIVWKENNGTLIPVAALTYATKKGVYSDAFMKACSDDYEKTGKQPFFK